MGVYENRERNWEGTWVVGDVGRRFTDEATGGEAMSWTTRAGGRMRQGAALEGYGDSRGCGQRMHGRYGRSDGTGSYRWEDQQLKEW